VLRHFIASQREEILGRARRRFASRSSSAQTVTEASKGLALFLDQLGEALRKAKVDDIVDHRDITRSAGEHGDDLFHRGLSIAQVVQDYGDICQVITGLADEQAAIITAREFQTLNLCIDDAIASAVTSYGQQRERLVSDEGTEKLGILAHEMRNALNTAMLSFDCIKKGQVATGGGTSAIVDRSLTRMNILIDRSLADVRLDAGKLNLERVAVAEIVEEVEVGGALFARARGLHFVVDAVDRSLVVEVDRPILAAALANLVQNALKFTRPGTTVKLGVRSTASRVRLEVEDECGGLPDGGEQVLVKPFAQRGRDRSGMGLGLTICLKAMKTLSGMLCIRDIPGKGCVFTLDLPRHNLPSHGET
jgi:signal transduction histidine kinase